MLVSPAIGVTGAAALARWQRRAGRFLGLRKLAWNSLELEYDPFKYGSFAVNAADVVHRLTIRINEALDRQRRDGRARSAAADPRIPVDRRRDRVDAGADRPADGAAAARGDELVVFDIDRSENVEALLAREPSADIQTAMGEGDLPFSVSLVTNRDAGTDELVVRHQPARSMTRSEMPLEKSWPPDIVSLSHNALPFPPADELYGAAAPADSGRLYLGNLSFRGERGLLAIPADAQLRLRWNPFYDYLERRSLVFMSLD